MDQGVYRTGSGAVRTQRGFQSPPCVSQNQLLFHCMPCVTPCFREQALTISMCSRLLLLPLKLTLVLDLKCKLVLKLKLQLEWKRLLIRLLTVVLNTGLRLLEQKWGLAVALLLVLVLALAHPRLLYLRLALLLECGLRLALLGHPLDGRQGWADHRLVGRVGCVPRAMCACLAGALVTKQVAVDRGCRGYRPGAAAGCRIVRSLTQADTAAPTIVATAAAAA